MKSVFALLMRELMLLARQKTEGAALILFFVIVLIMMPFALGPEPALLQRTGPGLIWIAVVLMSLLSLDRLFIQDLRDGTLDEILMSPLPLELIVFAKLLALTLIILGTLLMMAIPALLLFNISFEVAPVLLFSFVLGIPSIVFLGGIASGITVSLSRHTALLTLLLVPFYIPILIFAVSACDAAASGSSPAAPLLLLSALLAVLLPSAPLVIASSLRS